MHGDKQKISSKRNGIDNNKNDFNVENPLKLFIGFNKKR